ncbi:MAG: 23S rRNA (pseudouridine(1915)-N(3))-methyltransferase RlmH [Betaproteobacteria bacterium]
MPRLSIVAIGDKLPEWATIACDEYLKRLPRGFEAALVEVRAEPRSSGKSVPQLMAAEATKIRAALPRGTRLVGLDERGKDMTTTQFSARLRQWLDSGVPTAFLVGGPDGLDPALKGECEALLRLSSFTLPHALARAVFAEQLYRAACVLTGHPYHRE